MPIFSKQKVKKINVSGNRCVMDENYSFAYSWLGWLNERETEPIGAEMECENIFGPFEN